MRLKLLIYPALNLLARLRRPRLAARLLAMTVTQLPGQAARNRMGRAQYRVLVLNLNKPGFPEDIEESLLSDSTFAVSCWPN
jgi:hypothetical protein